MRNLLLHLYPRRWRRRYGDEFSAVLESTHLTPRVLLDVVGSAACARWRFGWRPLTGGLGAATATAVAALLFQLCLLAIIQLAAAAAGHSAHFNVRVSRVEFWAAGAPLWFREGPGALYVSLLAGLAGGVLEAARLKRGVSSAASQ